MNVHVLIVIRWTLIVTNNLLCLGNLSSPVNFPKKKHSQELTRSVQLLKKQDHNAHHIKGYRISHVIPLANKCMLSRDTQYHAHRFQSLSLPVSMVENSLMDVPPIVGHMRVWEDPVCCSSIDWQTRIKGAKAKCPH